MKQLIYLFTVLSLSLIISSCSLSERHEDFDHNDLIAYESSSVVSCTSPIIDAVNQIGDAGIAKLKRNQNKISMNFKVENLEPGYAYSIWWVIWNKPENCGNPFECGEPDFGIADEVQVEVLYAAGHVVGQSGKGYFSGSLKENDDSGSINDLFGLPGYGGLTDAQSAEVHLVLRSHGPSIPGQVNEQINSYPGGCEIDFLPFTEIPDEEGECGDYMFSVFTAECGA